MLTTAWAARVNVRWTAALRFCKPKKCSQLLPDVRFIIVRKGALRARHRRVTENDSCDCEARVLHGYLEPFLSGGWDFEGGQCVMNTFLAMPCAPEYRVNYDMVRLAFL